jgi:KDEL-tailed cysteine endopeptidase
MIKNQQSCGSCWAFAATSVYEAVVAVKNQAKPIRLSEQEMVDCDTRSSGCGGGFYTNGWEQSRKAGGAASYESYPYKNAQTTCKTSVSGKRAPAPTGSYDSPKGEAAIVAALKNGPLAVAIDASSALMKYTTGIFTGPCTTSPNHAVVLAGYKPHSAGKQDGYWLILNSWSDTWGEKGFIRIGLGNTCGVQDNVYSMKV